MTFLCYIYLLIHSIYSSHEFCRTMVNVYVFCPQTCQSKVFDLSDGVSQYAWFPCREAQGVSWYPQYWLKVGFFYHYNFI